MPLPSVFETATNEQLQQRLEQLRPDSPALWGKMDAAQMLAHVNTIYAVSFGDKPSSYSFFLRLIMKWFVKPAVVNEQPYKHNLPTAPAFKVANQEDFEKEKAQLLAYMKRTQELGADYFEGKKSPSFGKMTSQEWNNQFYKHLDHHFRQFDV